MNLILRRMLAIGGIAIWGLSHLSAEEPNVGRLPVASFDHAAGAADLSTPYTIGAEDQLIVRALHVPEIPTEPVRVDGSGNLNLPLIGSVHVAGMTVSDAQQLLERKFSEYVRNPEVTLMTTELKSRPVFVLGSVNKPGEYQLRGQQTLAGLLSQCEGVRPDAGYRVLVTRQLSQGVLPLAGAVVEKSSDVSRATLPLSDVTEGGSAAANLVLHPNDVVSIPRGQMVYVVGDVKKAGGFVLQEREKISVLQALALAEGLSPTASIQHAKIMRSSHGDGAPRTETAVDLKAILAGRGKDIELESNDILFVPSSAAKGVWTRSLEAAIQMGTGVVIWHR